MLEDNDSTSRVTRVEEEPPPRRKYYIERGPEKDPNKTKSSDEIMQILMDWPNWDVWPFKLAVPVVGFAAAVPGVMFNNAFRSTLLLGNYGRFSSMLAVAFVPAVTTGLVHFATISRDIVEQKTKCPVCVQVRSASVQLVGGVMYPAFFTAIVNFGIGSGLKGVYIPKLTKSPLEVVKYAVEIFKTMKTRFVGLAMLQVVTAMGMTYFQQECYFKTLLPIILGENEFSKDSSTSVIM